MFVFWEPILEPVLRAVAPARILEIGSEAGATTRRLLEYCQEHDAVLDSIDPSPRYDHAAWAEEFKGHFNCHIAPSIEVLPSLDTPDIGFIDGDHNWYTVYNELNLINARADENNRPFPFLVFHDVGWPYDRRDLYYDPQTIPEDFRHPHERKGILPGQSALQQAGGANAQLFNADHEGGARNGVLTAIEDFRTESLVDMEYLELPGFHGLGMLFAPAVLEDRPELVQLLESLRLSPPLRQYVRALEDARLRFAIALLNNDTRHKQQVAELEARIQSLSATLDGATGQEALPRGQP